MLAPPIPAWGLAITAFGLLWLCLWRSGLRLLGVPLLVLGMASGAWQSPPDILVSADARLIVNATSLGGLLMWESRSRDYSARDAA